ncbi:hypothetical protein NDI37_24530 [Funiculus sociatus GB2-A5]|uniref:Uncharacterized protein n=1 Tax=Funiculus sociatus GB2-A5 TaxID=2933946 RepID=A0ABV0JVZ2_9CYAN|nr:MULTISPECIES: hypothetical protein [unclassified Trichocoleus]MBD1907143.1 hypothetical protein [Trichocoleus sp. FACHB-832]MBD2062164.1 hypothetical protein [Trichocoleus sp. FACHB-6]
MVLTSSQSINLKLSSPHSIPNHLKVLLNKIRLEHYEELYEPEADGTTPLQNTLNKVLNSLRSSNQRLNHLRYLWMTLILTLVVEPTLEYYQPSNSLPKYIIDLITLWLRITTRNTLNNSKIKITELRVYELIKEISEKRDLSSDRKLASFQTTDEALDVFKNAVRVIDYEQALEAIIEILDDCLEGYAIFPGSYGRRELFDWWLLDVVPASWYLLPPKSFYVVESLQNQENIKSRQTNLLGKASFEIWDSLLGESNSKEEANSHILYCDERYTSTKINKVRLDRKVRLDNLKLKLSISNSSKNTQSEPVYFM